MWYIVAESGVCFLHLNLIVNEDGSPLTFHTRTEALMYAQDNCAWKYQVHKW